MVDEETEPVGGTGFAPQDPLDGRALGDWKSRYIGVQRWIYLEAAYLMLLLAAAVVGLFLIWHGNLEDWLSVGTDGAGSFSRVCYVWVGGLVGGTTFAMKWLYHSVARGRWHMDRRLWRIFMPHLSAALALAVLAFLTSGLLGVFDQHTLRQPTALFALAFLAGYFSDNTIAALARLADEWFGEKRRGRERGNHSGP